MPLRGETIDYGPTPMTTIPDGHVLEVRIPGPRGLIVSREGVPLAQNEVRERLVVRLPPIAASSEEALRALRDLRERVGLHLPWFDVSKRRLRRHLEHRPWIPIPLTGTLSREEAATARRNLPPAAFLESVYVRSYPVGELTAHVTGYIGDSLPDQNGPIGKVEYAWPPLLGRAGIESELDESLRGEPGIVNRLYDADGNLLNQEIAANPRPGPTHVLSLNLALQQEAWNALEASGRPGAFVAVDADTGDILALVSYPSFDPNLFVGGIPESVYRKFAERDDAPFFDRAVLGEYPPGSTFKPFVALAGMEWGAIDGLQTRYSGPPAVLIQGRPFKNWSDTPEGMMDLRYAIMRSCNTWFYQAAILMGARPIADVSRRFGFGAKPDIPLPAVGAGNIPDPEVYRDPKSLANFSIGQGVVLASPLQMALSMSALANGAHVPRPRLVVEKLDPFDGSVVERIAPAAAHHLHLDPQEIEWVREGMWGVVNHGAGTAGRARLDTPVVYGKTGTSQWAEDAERRSLAWFTGWVDAENPKIAFAAVTQGRRYETLSGGRSAAPIAARILRSAYGDPESFAVTVPEGPSRPAPLLSAPEPALVEVPVNRRPLGGVGRFFRRLLGGPNAEPEEEEAPLPDIMTLTSPYR